MTVILSGFADEISPDLDEQLAVLAAESIFHLELRSVWSTNVADLDDGQLARVRQRLDRSGVRVSAIGSPIGKIDIDAPIEPELERLRRVADIADQLATTLIRVFSFFIPEGHDAALYRARVIDRMRALAELAAERGLILAHENEKKIYGDQPDRCADIIESVGSPALRATFDAANFVQCGVRPHSDAYELLRPYLVYVQVKDAVMATGDVVPAGRGDGQVGQTLAALRDSGFQGYLSLEPHLAMAGRFGGFSGPELFQVACRALKDLLADLSVPWQ
ncbi:MAG TPA: sugar phosphate isomerase/epimerase family protein [Streptosporangiaceae bacterium]|nr:sugar phosphate isomerase/epimerase family protein [Streptosporangiaceae bacterium]